MVEVNDVAPTAMVYLWMFKAMQFGSIATRIYETTSMLASSMKLIVNNVYRCETYLLYCKGKLAT